MSRLFEYDPEIAQAVENELIRERQFLEMIPSENSVSFAVLEAMGTVPTNKYSEGYPCKQYYGGNQWIDVVETCAIAEVLKNPTNDDVKTRARATVRELTEKHPLFPGLTVM